MTTQNFILSFKQRSLLTVGLRSLTAGIVSCSMVAFASVPGWAAERVYLDFRLLSRSVSTESLVNLAETGTIDEELAPYLRRLTSEQQQAVRTALMTSRPVDLVHLRCLNYRFDLALQRWRMLLRGLNHLFCSANEQFISLYGFVLFHRQHKLFGAEYKVTLYGMNLLH
jgi:hypothetical protein